jgi:lysophospholipase L1-like esterase
LFHPFYSLVPNQIPTGAKETMSPKISFLTLALLGSSFMIGCSSGGSSADNTAGGANAARGGFAGASASSGAGASTGGASSTGGANGSSGAVSGGAPSASGGGSSAGNVGIGGASAGGAGASSGGASAAGASSSGASAGGASNAGASGASTAGAGAGGASSAGGAGSVDPSKKITVWLAGDSTMQLCSTACPCGWGSQFQPYLSSNAKVVDSGAGGRSIQTWLYDPNVTTTVANGECVVSPKTYSARWQAMLDPTNGMKPGDYLFIEFGINDGDAVCNRHVGTALFQTYLQTMVQAAKDRGAQAVLLTSTSFMECTGTKVNPNRGFGPQTKAAATAEGVPLIDLTVLSAALYTSLGLCPNALDFTSTTSAVGKFFCDDHTHFESAGAVQVAGVVAKALRDQNIGLAAYLK